MKIYYSIQVLFLLFVVIRAYPSLVNDADDDDSFINENWEPEAMISSDKARAKPVKFYMKDKSCPFAKWFKLLPKNYGKWEHDMKSDYVNTWEKDGSPIGCQYNDHNFGTKLGQGNTLGFLTGRLDIDVTKLAKDVRVGLFANKKSYKTIVRFSDFNPDGGKQLGRMAVKIDYPNAWKKEINLLTTETLAEFPFNGYADLTTTNLGFFDKVKNGFGQLGTIFFNLPGILSATKDGRLLQKEYYSQLPYAIGNKKAMKFRFKAHDKNQKGMELEGTKDDRLKGINDYITKNEAVFDFQIQLHDNQKDELIMRGARKPWKSNFITVGTLTLVKQAVDKNNFNIELRKVLSKHVKSKEKSEDLHKAFFFHPILTCDEHKPLGEVNSFRADFYSQHASARYETYLQKEAGLRSWIPFSMLNNNLFGLQKPAASTSRSTSRSSGSSGRSGGSVTRSVRRTLS